MVTISSIYLSYSVHVYLHLGDFYGKCSWISHTWSAWDSSYVSQLRDSKLWQHRQHQITVDLRISSHTPSTPQWKAGCSERTSTWWERLTVRQTGIQGKVGVFGLSSEVWKKPELQRSSKHIPWRIHVYPCMVDWCQHEWGISMVNVTICTIHGSYGYV